MKFDYMVKRHGIYYPAGAYVPDDNIGDAPIAEEVKPIEEKIPTPKEEVAPKKKVAKKK